MDSTDIALLVRERAARCAAAPALSLHGDSAERYTYAELDDAAGRLAAGLIERGLTRGDRVAILSESRPRWGIVFFAVLRAGGIAVPLDPRQTMAELHASFADAKPVFLFASLAQEAAAATLLAADDHAAGFSLDAPRAGQQFESMDRVAADASRTCVVRDADDVAVISYTSGTMGPSKGVATTFANLIFEMRAVRAVMQNDAHVATVSMLPLSHLFELTAGFLGVLHGGGSIRFCPSLLPDDISAAMREQRVTCMTTVPLFLQTFAAGLLRRVANGPRWQRVCFAFARCIACGLPLPLRRRLFRSLHEALGGHLEYFVCGGAPLPVTTERFFASLGIPVYQGYGLAEASPVLSTNAPARHRPGSVGLPLPGVEIRIAANGEILTRGPQVMQGYFGQPAHTASVVDADGWLHTGDVGHLDADGYLYIDGRRKNTIVLASGKKVQPEELESVLFEHHFIAEGCVIAATSAEDGHEEVCAIAVATEAAMRYCRDHATNLGDTVRRVIDTQARNLAPAKRPTRFYLRSEPLPRTSTRKVRRPDLRRWLSEQGALS